MYYLCSKNKGADQLYSYHEADLRLCFRICTNPVFSRCGWYMFCLICLGGLSHDVILSIFHVLGEYGKIVSDRIIILYSVIINLTQTKWQGPQKYFSERKVDCSTGINQTREKSREKMS